MFSRDMAYSLFGGPLILDVGPSINGEIIRVRVQPINTISVTALVISLLLFIAFMCFYLHPLYRKRRALAASKLARSKDVEQPGSPEIQIDEEEKKSLLSWLYLRSRDRFSTHDQENVKVESPSMAAPSLRRQPSSFARGSLIPDLSPTLLTPPPPAYASRPSSPLAEYRFPSPLSSPRSQGSKSPRPPSILLPSPVLSTSSVRGRASSRVSNTQRVQFDMRPSLGGPQPTGPGPVPVRARSASSTLPSGTTLSVRPFIAPRSVSANTLHPADAHLHVPSRAKVYSPEESSRSDVSPVRRVARHNKRESTGLGMGVSLAARGRQLTRGPSASWTPGVGRIGHPF